MADRLNQVLSFVAVPPLGSVAMAYQLGVDGNSPILPDFIFLDASGFTISLPVNTTTITVTNTGLVAASVNVWLMRLHTFDRVFGNNATQSLSPQPFIVSGGSGGSGGVLDIQAFRYIATGVEGTDFFVALPAARPSDLYRVVAADSGVVAITPFDFPDILVGDRTTTQFRCVTAAALAAGDQIDLVVLDAT